MLGITEFENDGLIIESKNSAGQLNLDNLPKRMNRFGENFKKSLKPKQAVTRGIELNQDLDDFTKDFFYDANSNFLHNFR